MLINTNLLNRNLAMHQNVPASPTPYLATAPTCLLYVWGLTFPRLCAAIVDRLTFGGNIIETGTDFYRLAQTRARAGHASS